MTAIQFLNQLPLRYALPFSVEKAGQPMSKSELIRQMNQGAVLFNGEKTLANEEIDFQVFSLVFFPNGLRRTTIC